MRLCCVIRIVDIQRRIEHFERNGGSITWQIDMLGVDREFHLPNIIYFLDRIIEGLARFCEGVISWEVN